MEVVNIDNKTTNWEPLPPQTIAGITLHKMSCAQSPEYDIKEPYKKEIYIYTRILQYKTYNNTSRVNYCDEEKA